MVVAEADAGTAGTLPVTREDSTSPLERLFGVRAQGSTVGIEVRARITTFMVMAYIILFIGLFEGGFVRVPQPLSTPLTLGSFTSVPFVIALLGLVITVVLVARGVKGALLAGILVTTVVATVVRAVTGAEVSSVPTAA